MTASEVLTGNNWHIERMQIAADFAAEVCKDIGHLAVLKLNLPDEVLSKGVYMQGKALSGYWCNVEPSPHSETDHLLNYPKAVNEIPNLLHLFDMRRKAIGSTIPGFGISVIGSHGSIKSHRDAYQYPSSAITLEGESKTTIVDPITNKRHTFKLAVGDAYVLQNPSNGLRPEHGTRNNKLRRSVTFVI